jgi:N utilization substance protein B
LGKRRKSREIAIQLLYQLEINRSDAENAQATFWDHYSPPEALREFTHQILAGVFQHLKEIDQIIIKVTNNWSLDRMTIVDRSILREAIFEILFCPDIPVKVTLNEAIELGKKYGSEKSGSFINGILDKVVNQYSGKK